MTCNVCPKTTVALSGLLVGLLAGPAAAHGDIQASDPAPHANVRRAPRSIAITFTEAPTAQAVLMVRDGCNRNVGQGVDVVDATATVRVVTGQPGRWRVSYRVISALDGHRTQGGYAFTVAGERDCTPDEATPPPATDGGSAGGTAGDDPGSGAPVVPIALGAAGLVLVALVLRRAGSR